MKESFKLVGRGVWDEVLLNFWFWASAIAYMFDAKEVALAWILAGIYFKAADIFAEIKNRNLVTLSMTFVEEKGETP